jgi:transcription termination factor Rho
MAASRKPDDDAPARRPKTTAKTKKAAAPRVPAARKPTPEKAAARKPAVKSPAGRKPRKRADAAAQPPAEATALPPAPTAPLATPASPAPQPPPPWGVAPAALSGGRSIPPLPEDVDDPEPYEPALADAAGDGAGDDAGDDPGDDDGDDDDQGDDDQGDGGPQDLLEAVRRGERHVSTLDSLSDAQLLSLAKAQGWTPRQGERRGETIFRLLQGRAQAEAPEESVFVEGLLELHPDGYGFLRRPQQGYAQHPLDVYVPAGVARRVGLKAGHWVSGQAHRARPQEPTLALHEVEEVNHEDPARLATLTPFEKLTVVYPDQRYVLEVKPEDVEMRLMDLFCPLGRGQRGLIVAPPRSGKTVILQKIADSIAHNAPNADIVVLLVDERPEEVTNMRRSVRGEVIASTFDKPVANHVRVAELAIEKVKRMVEMGRDVVMLLDSITRLGRAYNNLAPTSGRILSGGMDAGALTKPKNFFAAARNVEGGGSLTILATALVDTGSRLDTLVFEEFKGSGNMELVLDRDLANQRIWPAINIPSSGTRNEDLLLHPDELRRITRLRRALSDHAPADAMVLLKDMMKQHLTNAEMLLSME